MKIKKTYINILLEVYMYDGFTFKYSNKMHTTTAASCHMIKMLRE
jgi:hypothetical protein